MSFLSLLLNRPGQQNTGSRRHQQPIPSTLFAPPARGTTHMVDYLQASAERIRQPLATTKDPSTWGPVIAVANAAHRFDQFVKSENTRSHKRDVEEVRREASMDPDVLDFMVRALIEEDENDRKEGAVRPQNRYISEVEKPCHSQTSSLSKCQVDIRNCRHKPKHNDRLQCEIVNDLANKFLEQMVESKATLDDSESIMRQLRHMARTRLPKKTTQAWQYSSSETSEPSSRGYAQRRETQEPVVVERSQSPTPASTQPTDMDQGQVRHTLHDKGATIGNVKRSYPQITYVTPRRCIQVHKVESPETSESESHPSTTYSDQDGVEMGFVKVPDTNKASDDVFIIGDDEDEGDLEPVLDSDASNQKSTPDRRGKEQGRTLVAPCCEDIDVQGKGSGRTASRGTDGWASDSSTFSFRSVPRLKKAKKLPVVEELDDSFITVHP